jgi:hypothetical protein
MAALVLKATGTAVDAPGELADRLLATGMYEPAPAAEKAGGEGAPRKAAKKPGGKG